MTFELKQVVIKLVESNAQTYLTAIQIKEKLRKFPPRDALDIVKWVTYSLENEIEELVKEGAKK